MPEQEIHQDQSKIFFDEVKKDLESEDTVERELPGNEFAPFVQLALGNLLIGDKKTVVGEVGMLVIGSSEGNVHADIFADVDNYALLIGDISMRVRLVNSGDGRNLLTDNVEGERRGLVKAPGRVKSKLQED